jgi:hypothetical protein
MGETHILIRLLWMYFPQNWEFGSALSKLWNFGGGLNPTKYTIDVEVISLNIINHLVFVIETLFPEVKN